MDMDKSYDPLLHENEYDSLMDMQAEVSEWWYDMYDKLKIVPLWEHGCPNYHEEYGQRQPSLAFAPYDGPVPLKGVVLVSAGGGFTYKSHHEGACVAKRFAQDGYLGAVLDYRVRPYTQYDILDDVSRAVRLLKSLAPEYGYPQENIVLLGFSAGGQASLLGGTHFDAGNPLANDPIERFSSRPGAVVSCYSALSWTNFPCDSQMDEIGGIGGIEDRLFFSAEHNLSRNMPPVFLWTSRQDMVVDPRHSIHLALRLIEWQLPFELHVYDSGAHGIGMADETNILKEYSSPHLHTWVALCSQWLDSKFCGPCSSK